MKQDDYKKIYSGPQKKQRPTGKRRKKRRSVLSVLLTIALALTAFLLATAATGYFLITHRPADYQPRQWSADPKVRKQQQKEAENRGLKKSEEFYNNAHRMEPFTFRFEENIINDILLLDDIQDYFKRRSKDIAKMVGQLQVRFKGNQVHLMGEIHYQGVTTIMTASFGCALINQEQIEISLDKVKAGAMPIPEAAIDTQLESLAQYLQFDFPPKKQNQNIRKSSAGDELLELLFISPNQLSEVIINKSMKYSTTFRAVEDKYARITAIEIGDGYIDMSLEPFWVDE